MAQVLRGVPVVPRIPSEWKKASVLGVGLEEQPEEDAQGEPVGQVKVVGSIGDLPLQFPCNGDRKDGDDLDVDPLPKSLTEFCGEAFALLQEVLNRSAFGEGTCRERQVEESGILAGQECQIDLEVRLGLTSPALPQHPETPGRGVPATLSERSARAPLASGPAISRRQQATRQTVDSKRRTSRLHRGAQPPLSAVPTLWTGDWRWLRSLLP